MTLKAAVAATLLALSFATPASADTLPADAPYYEDDAAGRSVMP